MPLTRLYAAWGRLLATGCVLGLLCGAPQPAQARVPRGGGDERVLEVPVGSSQLVRVPAQVDRVVVGDPSICDVVALPPGQLLLTTKAAGETVVTVWSRSAGATSFHVSATAPVAALQAALRDAFPDEDDLTAHAAGGAVYLTGTVTDASVVEAAGRLANNLMMTSSRKVAEVVNLTTMATSQQVQVQLKFVEVSRTSLRQLGFNAWMRGNQDAGALFGPNDPRNYYDTPQNFIGPAGNGNSGTMPILVSPVQGAFALSFATGRFGPLSLTLSLLEGNGVAKTLSEPTLVANSGEKAHFIVGGEFPVPVPDPLGRVIVQFKPYGAQLTFTPTVVAQDMIHLELDSVVSDIDKQNSTTVGTSQVPGIVTRQSSTAVRMRDGQSFAIAGLLSDRISAQDKRVPILGDLPLVGALFRNTNYSRDQEELVVLVSTRLVKPMDPGEVPQPVTEDEFNDPGDLRLFLLGHIETTGTRQEGKTFERPERPEGRPAPRRSGARPAGAVPSGLMGFSRETRTPWPAPARGPRPRRRLHDRQGGPRAPFCVAIKFASGA